MYKQQLVWLYEVLTGCWRQPVNTSHNYTNCCIYRVDPPEDEQQVCSKHVDAYYWNKLIESSASCWFALYGYITMHGKQNIKSEHIRTKYFVATKSIYLAECKMQIRLLEVSTIAVMPAVWEMSARWIVSRKNISIKVGTFFFTKCRRISSASVGIVCWAICREWERVALLLRTCDLVVSSNEATRLVFSARFMRFTTVYSGVSLAS
jgi:hypothetical protein